MIIFQPTQTLMRVFGYLFTYSQSPVYIAYNYVVYAFSSSIMLPILLYFISNITNLSIVAETMSLCSGEVNAMIKGLVYIRNRDKVRQLFERLQQNVDLKASQGRLQHYASMNRQATILSRINIGWMTNSIGSICLGPLLSILYHRFYVGDLSAHLYRQPVGLKFPWAWDLFASPTYECIYALCFVAITCIGYTIVMTDCVFMGVCTQIIAAQRDLQDMLLEVDASCRPGVQPFSASEERGVERHYRECICFHRRISRDVEDLRSISSPIIFAQFILSVLQMGTLAFQIQVAQNITVDRYVANVVTGIVALTELLIYCYFGNTVTVEGVQVAQAAYNSAWYRGSARLGRYVYVIMMRTQRPDIFQGLKMVNCSLASYTTVLNMVGSSLALLRSVV